jgi:hypothetical protein
MLDGCAVKGSNGNFCLFDVNHHGRFRKFCKWIVISFMSLDLHSGENGCKLNYFRRKFINHSASALTFRMSMLERAINLSPCRCAAIGALATDQRVCATPRQRMEQRVIGSADGAAKGCLFRLAIA